MLTTVVVCLHCGGEDVVRNGKQRLLCKGCKCEERQGPRYSETDKETILRADMERPSMRGIGRIFGVSQPMLIDWLKKDRDMCYEGSSQRVLKACKTTGNWSSMKFGVGH